MPKKLTTETFIEKSKGVHGDKYNYENVTYKDYNKNVPIICEVHGIFLQTPGVHLSGCGCPICGGTKKLTKIDFINKAKKIHGNKYKYNHVVYKNNRIKVKIKCNKCKKYFNQSPNYHLLGEGCLKCSGKYKYTTKEFIEKSQKIHKNKYDYSRVNYINSHTKIEIICETHGIFRQTPYSHIQGSRCPVCTFKTSKLESEFLDYIKVPNTNRNINVIEWKKKKIDGYDKNTNTVYEFLGDYYHGNPDVYDRDSINPTCKKTFNELYSDTLTKLKRLKHLGYNVKYIWESDWKKFKKNLCGRPKIYTIKL